MALLANVPISRTATTAIFVFIGVLLVCSRRRTTSHLNLMTGLLTNM
jgi:hypothetical protein